MRREVTLDVDGTALGGELATPANAWGLVVFAHGSGSGRHSPRNQQVAQALQDAGAATLLMDLLTEEEELVDRATAELRFDVDLLGERVVAAVDWAADEPDVADLPVGAFGASTGAAAALRAAADRPRRVGAVVSRGGRPDLASHVLPRVAAPTLLLVGGRDEPVIDMNRTAAKQLAVEHQLEIVPGATHLFEEPGALETVADMAANWFARHLREA